MLTPVFPCNVENGKLTFERPDLFQKFIKAMKNGRKMVTVKDYKKPRSTEQNKYYWGVVVKILADEFGYENPMDCHQSLRDEFLLIQEKPLRKTRSTTSLSTVEMEEYLARIRMWALNNEPSIYIPLPNEVELPDYE